MRSLVKEALAADAEIERTGEVYRASDVPLRIRRQLCIKDPFGG